MSTELATLPATGQIQRTHILADALEQATKQRALLARYVEKHMREGVDFGTIPGTPKPSLWKPGAEKILSLYRCTATYEVVTRVEQWGEQDENPLFHYEFKCKVTARDTDKVVAEGVGSCNTMEPKYARKRDGSPADPFAVVNTVLKMAKKRSLVDAAIALGCCSDVFTQDIEDLDLADREAPAPSGLAGDFRFGWDLQAKKDGPVVHAVKGKLVSEVSLEVLTFAAGRWEWLATRTADTTKRAQYAQQLATLKRAIELKSQKPSKTTQLKEKLKSRVIDVKAGQSEEEAEGGHRKDFPPDMFLGEDELEPGSQG